MEINNALDLYLPVPTRVYSATPLQPISNTHPHTHTHNRVTHHQVMRVFESAQGEFFVYSSSSAK